MVQTNLGREGKCACYEVSWGVGGKLGSRRETGDIDRGWTLLKEFVLELVGLTQSQISVTVKSVAIQ